MINTIGDPQMDKYYEFRKEIHKLYDHDVYNTGDLCSKILEIRDKEKSIESVQISLQSYTVYIELSSDTSETKINEVINKICNCIGRYIVDNRDKLDSKINEDESFNFYLDSSYHLYCDVVVVGKSINFYL